MARKPRVEWEGASYHVMARGNERAKIYHGEGDYRLFLKTLGESLDRFGVQLHGWCLMPNHFHLAITTPRGNLSRWMAWLQTTFTARYNRLHRRVGHLFQGRYRAELVEEDAYARQLVLYIHLNPVRKKSGGKIEFVGTLSDLDRFLWSGHAQFCGTGSMEGPTLSLEWEHYWGRGRKEIIRGYRRALQEALSSEPARWSDLVERGLVAGREPFVKKVTEKLKEQNNPDSKRWRKPIEKSKSFKRLRGKLKEETSRAVEAWVRMRLLGERGVDIAKGMGFGDGSGVTQAARRLDIKSRTDPELEKKLKAYRALSDVKN